MDSMNAANDMKGAILTGSNGAYVVDTRLGEGGVGTVYLAREKVTGIEVAIKLLHSKKFQMTDAQRERFDTEIKTSLKVDSKYVVKGVDCGVYDGEPFLVLERLSGKTLDDIAIQCDHDLGEVIVIASQLIKGMQELHSLGLIHRDIKPNNVLLCGDGGIKISDLGLIMMPDKKAFLTGIGDHIGSLLYVSKRQRSRPGEVTERDDFYSFYLVVYELIAKEKIHTNNVPLASMDLPSFPRSLCVLIDKGMRDEDDWFETFTELCQLIDVENERLNQEYLGSVSTPERILQKLLPEVTELVKSLPEFSEVGTDETEQSLWMHRFTDVLCEGFDTCASEISPLGIIANISINNEKEPDGSFLMVFGVEFREPMSSLLDSGNILEHVEENLYGWIGFECSDENTMKIDNLDGKRLYADPTWMPSDTFKRTITELDLPTKNFLRSVGRALAIGAAVGALDRIESVVHNEKVLFDDG